MKHGVGSAIGRNGSCFPEPSTEPMLSTWLSYEDLERRVWACGEAEEVGYATVWGAQDNAWRNGAWDRLGWAPCDSAYFHAEEEWIACMEGTSVPFHLRRQMVTTGSFRGEEEYSVCVWLRRLEAEREALYRAF